MNKLVCMGELLIDFQSKGTAELKNTDEFIKNAGGAPANVCVQAQKLGVDGVYLSQVGSDAFGEYLIDTLKKEGVNTDYIRRSSDYDTSLAFVSFGEGGERQFAFYRRTAADLYFTAEQFDGVEFKKGDVFEFGSVALKTEQARRAHDAVIERARRAGATVCFDPNLRFNLWESREQLKQTVLDYSRKVDVMKVGDDELVFLTGDINSDSAAKIFLDGGVKMLAVTRGSKGARLYLQNGATYDCPGFKVNAVDTTGAGDSFFGGLIAELLRQHMTVCGLIGRYDYDGALAFACKCGSYTTTDYGAIAAMGNRKSINKIGR